jgi:transposase-like protein DUF772
MWSGMRENYMAVVLDRERPMTLGLAQRQGDLLDEVTRFCDQTLPEASVYGLLHRERDRLFPDELFAELFADCGRRCVPPSVVATVMVLQRLEGLSDREAVERYTFDARWRYAAGVGGYDRGGWGRFAHTVLVDMRERLRRSDRPDRVFEVALAAAKQAGLVGRRRVLDSTPLYDAVATMDTVTLIGSALRGLLRVADQVLEAELRAVLAHNDGYASAAKPQIDWDDPAAREQLVDARAKDARACLAALDGCQLDPEVAEAAALLATVVGQDLEQGDDGVFRIARKVAADRIISTVDPRPVTATRPPPAALTATRVMWRSTPTRRSSPPPGPRPAMPVMPASPPISSPTCWLSSPPTGTTRPARPARRARRHASRTREPMRPSRPRCMGTAPTAPASFSPPWRAATSTPAARPSRPALLAGASPRTASTSASTATPSPAPPGTP